MPISVSRLRVFAVLFGIMLTLFARFPYVLPVSVSHLSPFLIPSSNRPYNMALDFRDSHDPDSCPDHKLAGWPKVCQDDRSCVPARDFPDWCLLQLELDLRQRDILVFECRLHSDAQGALETAPTAADALANGDFQATTPVAVLLATWAMGMAPVNLRVLFNVAVIVVGVIIASIGEIKFVMIGFLFQIGGIIFEATRLVMVQRLLSSPEYKMDPLVSLYYFAPVCAVMNGLTALFLEVPNLTMGHIYNVGIWTLVANAGVAFMLNVSVVFLVSDSRRSGLDSVNICPDWKDLVPCDDLVRCPEGYPAGCRLHGSLAHPGHRHPVLRLLHCFGRSCVLQAWRR